MQIDDFDDDDVSDYCGDRVLRVFVSCSREWIDETTVEPVDISEAIDGADLLRFRCPRCGAVHESTRRG